MTDTQQILATIKETGERTERAIVSLCDDVRSLTNSITKTLSQQTATRRGLNGNGTLLFGVSGVIFGLMMPIYIMVGGAGEALLEHKGLGAHHDAQAEISALREAFKEVETQFQAIEQKIKMTHRHQDEYLSGMRAEVEELRNWRLMWVDRVARIDATQTEKIRALEDGAP